MKTLILLSSRQSCTPVLNIPEPIAMTLCGKPNKAGSTPSFQSFYYPPKKHSRKLGLLGPHFERATSFNDLLKAAYISPIRPEEVFLLHPWIMANVEKNAKMFAACIVL